MSAGERARAAWARARPHLIGALVCLHAFASCALVPSNPAAFLDRKVWRDARVREELERWADTLGVTRRRLEDGLDGAGRVAARALLAVQRPLAPWQALSGVTQSWHMFAAGTRYADTFEVRARVLGGSWRPLYVRGAVDEAGLARVLESPRVRSATYDASWPSHERARARLCAAVARRAWRDDACDAECDVVECAFARTTIAPPGERAARGAAERSRAVSLERPRAAEQTR